MTTIIKTITSPDNRNTEKQPVGITVEQVLAAHQGENATLPTDSISLSPFNYRKYYNQQALEDFAMTLKIHGIISPLIVRRVEEKRYELVSGERRLRGAVIAGFKEVPVRIFPLTDEEVREIQLAENIQREDPHPMDEAQAIGTMQEGKKSIEEIAARMGKSKGYIYSRIKLLSLIEPFREMFYASKISMQEAVNIATLSGESQTELLASACKDWKKQKDFRIHNLDYLLSQFRYDLNRAPFDKKDKNLLPDVGSCQQCPFNSATLKSLFPEYAKHAVCSNKDCFQRKCTAQLVNDFTAAFEQHLPEAILFYGTPPRDFEIIREILPEVNELPQFDVYDVTRMTPPQEPVAGDFLHEEDGFLDEQGYEEAVEEYNADLQELEELMASKKVLTGLILSRGDIQVVQFSPEKRDTPSLPQRPTSKQVQEALKNKTATAELLQGEIDRIKAREERSKELDKEKVLLKVHEQFTEQVQSKDALHKMKLTADDTVAARLIIYQSLGYQVRDEVNDVIFSGSHSKALNSHEKLYERLANLTTAEHSYLIRQALLSKPESKYPTQMTGYALYKMAGAAGTDVSGIEKEQTQKAESRQGKLKERIKDLQQKMKKMKAAA